MRSPKANMFVLLVAMCVMASTAAIAGGGAAGDEGGGDPTPHLIILDPRLLNTTYTGPYHIPIIDGVVSPSEWDTAESTSALHSEIPPAWEETGTHITGPGIQNDSDASHVFWSMYDDEYLYFLFNCSDDHVVVDNYPDKFYRDDSMEVCIDGAHDMDENQRTDEGYEDGDTFNVPADGSEGIAYSLSGSSPHARYWDRSKDWYSAVSVYNTSEPSYYIIEMAIRLNTISNPAPTSIVGLNTGQNDDDDGGETKEGVIRWQGYDGTDLKVWQNETLWGELYFRSAIKADAGDPQVTVNQTDTVVFDGSGSWANHPEFSTVGSYVWTFMYDGEERTLTGVNPSFRFDRPGDYTLTLTVSDGTGVFDTDTVHVHVRDTQPPVADAGPDVVVDQGEEVVFDASGSTDNHPDFPDNAEFEWFFVTTEVIRLKTMVATYVFNEPGEYLVNLTVTDGSDNFDYDLMKVTVRDTEAPVANAGPDVTVDFGRKVRFDGGNSTDNVRVASYHWQFEWNDEVINFTSTMRDYPYQAWAPGVFNVTLTVYDDAGNWDNDTIIVTILDVTPPVATAGEFNEIDEDTEVTLNGELSHDDVGIVTYTWFVYFGAEEKARLDGRKARYTFTEPGLYDVTLRVIDAAGLWSEDTIQVSVLDVTPPVARMGQDMNVDEDEPVTFSAAESEDNVGIVGWDWTIRTEGEPDVKRTTEEFEYVFTMPGVYTIILEVKDRMGLSGGTEITVTVADVTPPEAKVPAPSYTIKVGQTLQFDGRSSSDNVGVVEYIWKYEMLGAPFEDTTANTSIKFDVQGNYTVTLTVKDAAGNEDTKSFWVLVEKPKEEEEPGFGAILAVVAVSVTASLVVGRRRR